jgi:hypothetical protein
MNDEQRLVGFAILDKTQTILETIRKLIQNEFFPREPQLVIDRVIQMHGGLSVSDGTILSHYARFERCSRNHGGPDEIHGTTVVKRILIAGIVIYILF